MDQLFAIDAQARAQKFTQSDRHLLRQQKARPLLDQIKGVIEAARVQALPSSALAKGCNYTLTLWSRLSRFLDYPQLELSNNLAENAIRPVALGRRELDPHRQQGGWPPSCSDRVDRCNMPSAQHTHPRLSDLDPAGIGRSPN